MSDVKEMQKLLEEKEASLKKSRNIVERGVLADEIKNLKRAISEAGIEFPEKKVHRQKEAPSRADHVERKRTANDTTVLDMSNGEAADFTFMV